MSTVAFFARNPGTRYPALMDVSISQRISELRQRSKASKELNGIYRPEKSHTYQGGAAKERRKIRLEEIKQQLAALSKKR